MIVVVALTLAACATVSSDGPSDAGTPFECEGDAAPTPVELDCDGGRSPADGGGPEDVIDAGRGDDFDAGLSCVDAGSPPACAPCGAGSIIGCTKFPAWCPNGPGACPPGDFTLPSTFEVGDASYSVVCSEEHRGEPVTKGLFPR